MRRLAADPGDDGAHACRMKILHENSRLPKHFLLLPCQGCCSAHQARFRALGYPCRVGLPVEFRDMTDRSTASRPPRCGLGEGSTSKPWTYASRSCKKGPVILEACAFRSFVVARCGLPAGCRSDSGSASALAKPARVELGSVGLLACSGRGRRGPAIRCRPANDLWRVRCSRTWRAALSHGVAELGPGLGVEDRLARCMTKVCWTNSRGN